MNWRFLLLFLSSSAFANSALEVTREVVSMPEAETSQSATIPTSQTSESSADTNASSAFKGAISFACFDHSIRTRSDKKEYVSCSGYDDSKLNSPEASTASEPYKRWVHKHMQQVAACFGADANVLFPLWSEASHFQVNLYRDRFTGFAQIHLWHAANHDFSQAFLKYKKGGWTKAEPDELEWLPEAARTNFKNNPTCKEYLKQAQWAVQRMSPENPKQYCRQARDLVPTEGEKLERSVQMNAILGAAQHMRYLHAANRDFQRLGEYFKNNSISAADQKKLTQAIQFQAGSGAHGLSRAIHSLMRSGVKNFAEFEKKLSEKSDFERYARSKKHLEELEKAAATKCTP
jgi:hypothetical protein